MRMRGFVACLLLAPLAAGCGEVQSTLVGGKPITYWLQALHESNAKKRKEAVYKLGNVGSADPAAWPAVLAALQDTDATVRCEAILGILKFGAASQEAVPQLERLRRQDSSPRVRDYARQALERIDQGFES
jgi:hypothetical protein